MTAPTHVLTVRSLSGQPLDLVTKAPVTSISVYGLIDLGARLAAAQKNPDLEVSVKEVES